MRRLIAKRKTAKTNARAKRRPRVKPLWRHPLMVAVGIVGGTSLLGAGGWLVWDAGYIQRGFERAKWSTIAIAAKAGFTVSEIFVDGRYRTSPEALRDALRLERGAPILAFDPDAARERITALPWVKRVAVERQLPDVVLLHITERQPMAIWQHGGAFSLIDSGGEHIPVRGLEAFRKLLVVVGKEAPAHTASLMDVLATSPELSRRVKAAVRIADRRWDLHLKNGLTVRLPEEDPAGAWRRLAMLAAQQEILDGGLAAVDLRYPDRVILRPGQAAPMAPRLKPQRET